MFICRHKKAHVIEIKITGGYIADKLDFVRNHCEKGVPVGPVFDQDEMIDFIGVNKGKQIDIGNILK